MKAEQMEITRRWGWARRRARKRAVTGPADIRKVPIAVVSVMVEGFR